MRACGRAIRTYSAAILLALTLAVPALADSGHSSTLDQVHINNFGRVTDTYYRGAQPVGADFDALKALGVKTIIDLQEYGDTEEPAAAKKAGLNYVRIGMTTRIVPTKAQLEQFLSIVNDPAQQPVYVHCAGGHHRTGVMTAVYRMTKDGWDGKQAFAEMKKYGFGADFLHPEFKQFVLAYHVPDPPAPIPQLLQAVGDKAGDLKDAALAGGATATP
jgi:protein tyrosine/serine phosphatase